MKKTDRKKPWARKKVERISYKIESRSKAKFFLIICEGANTEPSYFKSFPLGNAEVESYGLGQSKTSLVQFVIENLGPNHIPGNQEIWVVFDMDLNGDRKKAQREDFDNAIELAIKNDFRVAYSNDAFEFCRKIYQKLMEDDRANQNEAIHRAKVLLNKQLDLPHSDRNPCTTVFHLVEKLNQYL